MIKINLAPQDEIESPYWFLPEVLIIIISLGLSWYGVQMYLSDIENDISELQTQTESLRANYRTLKRETAEFDNLDKDIQKLNEKLNSLKNITISKISRFKPVILLEHLQNLKPDGLWFNYISDNSKSKVLTIVGKAFDSILVAEFMSSLEATKTQGVDDSDLRTQVYFEKIQLERISTTGATGGGDGGGGGEQNADQEITTPDVDTALTGENASQYWTTGDISFPEMKKFPAFQLTIGYAERVPAQEQGGVLVQ